VWYSFGWSGGSSLACVAMVATTAVPCAKPMLAWRCQRPRRV
jgi:hypothetical protein